MSRDLDLDFEFEDERINSRPKRQAPQRDAQSGAKPRSGGAPRGNARRKKNQTTSIIILAVEIVVFIALVVLFFVLKGKVESTSDKGAATATQTPGSINVDSDDFTLTCSKVQLVEDVNGNPAALIYFSFTNKTGAALSMQEVFPPSLTQAGQMCAGDADLPEYPAEYTNKDRQLQTNETAECCYAFSLIDRTSELTLTIHDNYSTFTDIGSKQIPIS